MASETDTSAGRSDPSTASAAAARLGPLLAGIRDDLRECLHSAKSLADDAGVPFSLSADRIATAMLYLHDVGLPHDTAMLRVEYQECRHLMVEQLLALALGVNPPPDGLTKEEYRDVLTEEFGPLPTKTLEDLRVMLTGRAAQLLQHVEELIGTVKAMSTHEDDTAFRPAKEIRERFGFQDQHELRRFLKAHPIRTKPAKTKAGKEIPNRPLIHIGDVEAVKRSEPGIPDPLDLPAEAVDHAVEEVQRRKAEVDARRLQGK